jgi:hypothetical protein
MSSQAGWELVEAFEYDLIVLDGMLSLLCHSPKTFAISERRELMYMKRSPDFFLTTNTATKFF